MTIGAGDVRAGGAYVEIGADQKGLEKGLAGARKRLEGFSSQVLRTGRSLAIAGAILTAPIILSIKKFAAFGDQIAKMAKRTGFSVTALSELSLAATFAGTSIEAVELGLKRMSRIIYDAGQGLKEAERSLDFLGISLQEIEAMSPDDQFNRLSTAIGKIADPTQRAAVAQEIFGRSGTSLLPLFAESADGLKLMREEARKLGIVLDKKTAEAAEVLTDDIARLSASILGLKLQIGVALLPEVLRLVKGLKEAIMQMTAWVSANKEAVVTYTKASIGILAIGTSLIALGGIIKVLIFSFSGLKIALAAALAVAPALPMIAAMLLLSTAVGLLYPGGEELARSFTIAGRSIGTIFDVAAEYILAVYDTIVIVVKAIPDLFVNAYKLVRDNTKKIIKEIRSAVGLVSPLEEYTDTIEQLIQGIGASVTIAPLQEGMFDQIKARFIQAIERAYQHIADDPAAVEQARREAERKKKEVEDLLAKLRAGVGTGNGPRGDMFITAPRRELRTHPGTFSSFRASGVAAGGVDRAINQIAENTKQIVKNTRKMTAKAGP